jgi:5-methylcytosine-specific restriction protein A
MPNKPKVHNPIPPYLRAKLQQQRVVDQERRRKAYEKQPERKADNAFYKTARWIRFRLYAMSLPENALCRACKEDGRIVAATQLDHVKPRKEHPELAYEIENVQGLCLSCHRKKTNRGE